MGTLVSEPECWAVYSKWHILYRLKKGQLRRVIGSG